MIDAIEKERLLPEFSVLDALEVFDHAWGEVKDETIVNCFAKAGVSKEKQTDALLVAYDPSRISRTSSISLQFTPPEFFPERITAKDVVSMDYFVNHIEPIINHEDISDVLDEVNLEAEEDGDGDKDILIEATFPQLGVVCQALELLRRYMIFSDNGECIHKCIN